MTDTPISVLLNETDFLLYLQLANFFDIKLKDRLKTTETFREIVRELHKRLKEEGSIKHEQ